MYNYLQRFAVGLEEIVIDQALFDGEFIQEFNEAEYKLKAVSFQQQLRTIYPPLLQSMSGVMARDPPVLWPKQSHAPNHYQTTGCYQSKPQVFTTLELP